jgi:alkylation response protein AidB-like acyl-CoA dehydrogenase
MNKPLPPPFASTATSAAISVQAAETVAGLAFASAGGRDHDGAFPDREVAELDRSGLLKAPLPYPLGGGAVTGLELLELLRRIGAGSLPLGRLYEGHVNALLLVLRYGDQAQIARAAGETGQGQLHGVWNTDDANGLRLVGEPGRLFLQGRKILCSGAGAILRPIVTATDQHGRRLMVMPRVEDADRADLSQWTAQGMRASATGAVDLSGLPIQPIDILGADGD